MLMPLRRRRGVTLIELAVTLTILALLLLAAVPGLSAWLAGATVRSTAEALQNALRLAQATAVARSRTTVLALTTATPAWNATPAANARNWYVRVLPLTDSDESASSADYVQGSSLGTQNAVTITGPALLCFNALGRQATRTSAQTGMGSACTAPSDDSSSPTEYTIARADGRTLKLRVYLGGRMRLCDTAKTLSNGDPDGC